MIIFKNKGKEKNDIMTATKKPSRPIICKGNQVYNKYVPSLCDNKCFLTTEKLSPTSHMFLFETASILLFMNIILSFIWYLIKFDQIIHYMVS